MLVLNRASSQVLPFQYYSAVNGLPSNSILTLYQDHEGFLWIGTTEGLSKFDGTAFTNYTTEQGLPSNYINNIIEDRQSPGTLWIATNGDGIAKLAGEKFTAFRMPQAEHGKNWVNVFMQDHQGTIWCGTDTGIVCIRNGTLSVLEDGGQLSDIRSLAEWQDSIVWIATGTGLFRYHEHTGKVTRVPLVSGAEVERLYADADGTVWVGMNNAEILHMRQDTIIGRLKTPISWRWGIGAFFFIASDQGENVLWVGTQSGVLKIPRTNFSSDGIIHYTVENGLPENNIRSFLIDREENLWFGGATNGLAKLSERNEYRFTLRPIRYPMGKDAAVLDGHRHLWVILKNGLLELWRDQSGQWHNTPHTGAPLAAAIPAVLSLGPGNTLWVCYETGMLQSYGIRYGAGASFLRPLRTLSLAHRFPAIPLTFLPDREGRIWYSIQGVGVVLLDPSRPDPVVRVFNESDSLPGRSIRAIYEDREGNIWCGEFREGLGMLSPPDIARGDFRRYTIANELPDNLIRSLHQDHAGRMLIGTRNGGLAIMDHGKISTRSTRDGLISNAVWCIDEDARGNFWIGTERGFQRLDSAGKSIKPRADLLGSPVWSCGIHEDQFAWMIRQEELIVLDRPYAQSNQIPPPTYITGMTVNEQPFGLGGETEFPNDQNNIMLHFVGLSFRGQKINTYLYRLAEVGHEWLSLNDQNYVTFAALKPGAYTFEVKAVNEEGVASVAPATVHFIILPPVWQRWWFIAGAFAFIVMLLTLGYRYRVNQLLKIERMRTRIATDLHDDIGASLSRIALFSEAAMDQAEKVSPRLYELAEKIGANARELLDAVGTLVWSIDPRHDRFEDVITQLKNFAQEMFSMKNIDFTFAIPADVLRIQLPLDIRKNILLIFKEAINNIVKHSACRKAEIEFIRSRDTLILKIRDDGKGMETGLQHQGHGLANMRMRAAAMGGALDIQSVCDAGTTVQLTLTLRGIV